LKVGITGATGRLGSRLVEYLSKEHEVITFGRAFSDKPWTLGVIPSAAQLNEIDVLIHLAWSLRDRERDFHLNVGGTLVLAQAAQTSRIPFLFISSVAANSNSDYGKSKAEAERLVFDCLGTVMRIGLVPDLNRYTGTRTRHFSLYPNLEFKVPVTSFELLKKSIDDWIVGRDEGIHESNLKTILSGEIGAKELFAQDSRYLISIPLLIIKFSLATCAPFSLRARNLRDAMLSVITNKSNKP
jgi:hypothetical protein